MPPLTTLHQVFALDAKGIPVSIDQVQRGKGCGCKCQACGTALIARQGDIRSWSFAHSANANCATAAESALHKAAKQVLLENTSLLTPAITVTRTIRLPDGRAGSGSAFRPAGPLPYHHPEAEKPFGGVTPDVTIQTEHGPVFIEIVVTNAVDRDKRAKLLAIGTPTLEITLRLPRVVVGGTAWDKLRTAVLEDLANRKWVTVLETDRLAEEATAAAQRTAERLPVPGAELVAAAADEPAAARAARPSPAPPPQPIGRNSFTFGHTKLTLRELPHGIIASVRSASLAVDPLVLAWLEKWGGKWSEKHRNWVFPEERGDRLREVLAVLEVRINNETAYARHQRVLEEYNRAEDEAIR